MISRRLTRSLQDRVLGGVCGGIGSYIGVDPWWVRVAFVILGAFTSGTGILIYVGLWLLLPGQSLQDLQLQHAADAVVRSRPEMIILIGGAVIVMGLIVLARNLGVLESAEGDAFLPLVVIVLGLMLLAKQIGSPA